MPPNPPNETAAELPLWILTDSEYPAWLARQSAAVQTWLKSQNFQAERLRLLPWPGPDGAIAGAVFGLGPATPAAGIGVWQAAALADRLPPGAWRCMNDWAAGAAERLQLGFGLGRYRFETFRTPRPAGAAATLRVPGGEAGQAVAQTLNEARDLINTPANHLGPQELADAVRAVATRHGAHVQVVQDAELARDYPLVAAVGQGSSRAPRLIDLRWGDEQAPKITLVGKGVCFDSGGLDIKPAAGMLLMKKDMGGAACALATAQLLMAARAPIRLRLLIPAVENSISGQAYRPGDVLRSRKGLTVEIGNTDAEGRLILADALAEADREAPRLLVDFATLTGAARTALGPELPAAFSPDSALLAELQVLGAAAEDPLWPLPLWSGYDEDIGSKVADVNNVASHAFAGAIIGALFLQRFVTQTRQWVHLDLYAWNARERAGRPVGAEAQCARAVAQLVLQRFR